MPNWKESGGRSNIDVTWFLLTRKQRHSGFISILTTKDHGDNPN